MSRDRDPVATLVAGEPLKRSLQEILIDRNMADIPAMAIAALWRMQQQSNARLVGFTRDELAGNLASKQVSYVLRRLIDRHWIERDVTPGDRRKARYHLTTAAGDALADLRKNLRSKVDEQKEALS